MVKVKLSLYKSGQAVRSLEDFGSGFSGSRHTEVARLSALHRPPFFISTAVQREHIVAFLWKHRTLVYVDSCIYINKNKRERTVAFA